MESQRSKGEAFWDLHKRETAFIIPNPWDAGSARILASLGFEALATTSAGFAFAAGRPDGEMNRDETLAHAAAIAAATDLPVSVDFGDGFGDSPEAAAETIRLSAATGVVGGSIEDVASSGERAPYEISHAAERVRAAAEATRRLGYRFTLTARAENFITGRPDLRDAIARLQAYQDAGADVLYAPGLRTEGDIRSVVRSVDRPVNVLMGLPGVAHTLVALSAMGVKRVSVGSALARSALGALTRAGREMRERGTFEFAADAADSEDIDALLKDGKRRGSGARL